MNMFDLIMCAFLGVVVSCVAVRIIELALLPVQPDKLRFTACAKLNEIWCFVREYVSVIGINTITDSVAEACRYTLHLLVETKTPKEFVTLCFTAGQSFAKAETQDDEFVAAQKLAIAVKNHLHSQLPEHEREKVDHFLTYHDSSKAIRESIREFIESRQKEGYKTRFIL